MALRGVGVGAEKNQFCAVIAQDNRVTGQVNVNQPGKGDDVQQQAEIRKARLLADAESVILPLERAVRLNMATDEERSRLESWERYSVLISRVDPANPEWPEMPQ